MQDPNIHSEQQKNLSDTADNGRDSDRIINELQGLDTQAGGQAENGPASTSDDYTDKNSGETTDMNQLPKIDRFANVAADTDTDLDTRDRDDVNQLEQNA